MVDVRHGYAKIRGRVGVLPQEFEPFDRLRPRETVAYWASLMNRSPSEGEVNGSAVLFIIAARGLSWKSK